MPSDNDPFYQPPMPERDPFGNKDDQDTPEETDPPIEPLNESEALEEDAALYDVEEPTDTPGYAAPTSYAPNIAPPTGTTIHCIQCGYNLTGIALGGTCPECGQSVNQSVSNQHFQTSGKATTSLVLGIISLLTCACCVGFLNVVFSPLAIIFGFLAINDINEKPHLQGKGMAIAGIICGSIGFALFLLSVLLMFLG